jgi:hypothetical protein
MLANRLLYGTSKAQGTKVEPEMVHQDPPQDWEVSGQVAKSSVRR